jgi:hypothetical protein
MAESGPAPAATGFAETGLPSHIQQAYAAAQGKYAEWRALKEQEYDLFFGDDVSRAQEAFLASFSDLADLAEDESFDTRLAIARKAAVDFSGLSTDPEFLSEFARLGPPGAESPGGPKPYPLYLVAAYDRWVASRSPDDFALLLETLSATWRALPPPAAGGSIADAVNWRFPEAAREPQFRHAVDALAREVPVGPVLPDPGTVQAGWLGDPAARHQYRYWDGRNWTDNVADPGVQAVDPLREEIDVGANETAPEQTGSIEVELPSGETRRFFPEGLRAEILSGRLPRTLRARSLASKPGKNQTEPPWGTVESVAASNKELRGIYRPVWDTVLLFAGYGAIAGIALKAIDTTVSLFAIDVGIGMAWLAFAFFAGIGSADKKWGAWWIGALAVSIWTGMNLFMTAGATALVGALFGVPAGMMVGTIVGLAKSGRAVRAPDAEVEGSRPVLLGLAVPAVALAVLIPAYVWFNVQLVRGMQS